MSKPTKLVTAELIVVQGPAPHPAPAPELGVTIKTYEFGYKVSFRHSNQDNNRLEFMGWTTKVEAPILTLSCGTDENQVEFRCPGDADCFQVRSPRTGPIFMTTDTVRDLDIAPKGRVLIKGVDLEHLIRAMIDEALRYP